MDESEYKEFYHSVNTLPCIFEKAVLTRRYNCEKVIQINIAEREAVGCANPEAQKQCLKLLELLRKNAAFSLKMTHAQGKLQHAKEIKVQCGGLNGLLQAINKLPTEIVDTKSTLIYVENICGLLTAAEKEYGGLGKLPFQEIIKSITAYVGRRKKTS